MSTPTPTDPREEKPWIPKVGDWVIAKASYCGENDRGCTDATPCPKCLEMCNRFVIAGEHYGLLFFHPELCNRDGGCRLDETCCSMIAITPEAIPAFLKKSEGTPSTLSDFMPIPHPLESTNSKLAAEIAELKAKLEEWRTIACQSVKANFANGPLNLHPQTQFLVMRFAVALAEKLQRAEEKYGYTDDWRKSDWQETCLQHLANHIHKGDPRDVAAYCAFAWHHGWSITGASDASINLELRKQNNTLRTELEAARKEVERLKGKTIAMAASRVREQMELGNEIARAIEQRDTALAAKDAAEKALGLEKRRVVGMQKTGEEMQAELDAAVAGLRDIDRALAGFFWTSDDGETLRDAEPDESGAPQWFIETWKGLRILIAALTPAPTQEPPAGGVTISTAE